MPGSAGGGHSGGFGGGHSGSFGGGSHSSGHSGSFGGGSSRSSGGGHSGTFGGGHSGTFGSGGSRSTGGRYYGGNMYRGNNSGCGCLSGAAAALIAPIVIVIVLVAAIMGVMSSVTGYDMFSIMGEDTTEPVSYELVTEQVEKAKLPTDLCTCVEDTVQTDLPDVLTEEDAAKISDANDVFYEKTGVQPYFMFMSGIDGDPDPADDTVQDYIYQQYIELFGADEGHFILLMFYQEDGSYVTWYLSGDDAYTVLDDGDYEALLDRIDGYAAASTDIGGVIAQALIDTANDCMTEETSYYVPADARTPLAADKCTPRSDVVETDLPDVLDDAGKLNVTAGIMTFYKTTGVQPYFILLSGIDGDAHPSDSAAETYLYDKYEELFGKDEGHLLLLMVYDEGTRDYITWYLLGDDAWEVFGYEDCEYLLDDIDYEAAFTTNVGAAVREALERRAQEWSGVTTDEPVTYEPAYYQAIEKTNTAIGIAVMVGMLVFAGIVVALLIKKFTKTKQPVKTTQTTYQQPYQQPYQQNAGDFGGAYQQPQPPKRANYPVRCPYCGATAYPKDDGTCEYCGSRLPRDLLQ